MSKIEDYGKGKFSYSFLKNFALSPKHAKTYLLREFKETPALIFGRLFHAIMSGQLNQEFIIYDDMQRPDLSKTMAATINKNWKREIIEEALENNLTVASADELVIASTMRESVEHHPLGDRLLTANGEVEQMYQNSILRGRADKVIPDQKLIIDWKSTQSINPDWIERDVIKYHYDLQAAIYNEVIGKDYSMLFLFIEKSEPYDVLPVMIEPDSETMQNGRTKMMNYYQQAIKCFESNVWPGISNGYPDSILYME